MVAVLALLLAAPTAVATPEHGATSVLFPPEPPVSLSDEREPHFAPDPRERSKKELWLREKARRPDARTGNEDLAPKRRAKETRPKAASSPDRVAEARLDEAMQPVGVRLQPLTTLYNIWNREALPLLAGRPWKQPFQQFLRDHYTRQSTEADTRLATLLVAAALKFRSPRVEVVSGYRSPKYNLMLRKKGHQVARESQHLLGTAIDFRVRGASTEALRDFVRTLHIGGVGYYPRNRFVHADTGKVRTWGGL
jgi:hypothetical protein